MTSKPSTKRPRYWHIYNCRHCSNSALATTSEDQYGGKCYCGHSFGCGEIMHTEKESK